MLLPLAAAKRWPPWLNRHSTQLFSGSSFSSLHAHSLPLQSLLGFIPAHLPTWEEASCEHKITGTWTQCACEHGGLLEVVHEDGENAQLVGEPDQQGVAARVECHTVCLLHELLHQL